MRKVCLGICELLQYNIWLKLVTAACSPYDLHSIDFDVLIIGVLSMATFLDDESDVISLWRVVFV